MNLGRILEIAMRDAAVLSSLTSAASEAELFDRVIALGRERGLEVTHEELSAVVLANRRAWLERWACL
jgi:hypothetical protein